MENQIIDQVENYEVLPNVNYGVYNALNLACEDLGQLHLETGFNPFGEGFVLNEEYITDSLLNGKNAPEIKTPEFIEKGDKATKEAFNTSLANCESLLSAMESKLNSPELSPEMKAKLQKIVTYLKMRIALLKSYIEKFKSKKNKLSLYQKLLALNYAYGELLEESFTEQMNVQNIINQFMLMQQNQAESHAHKTSVIEQAKQIIAENLKKQELANQQQAQVQAQQQTTPTVEQTVDNPYMDVLKELNAERDKLLNEHQQTQARNENARPAPSQQSNSNHEFER